MTTDREAAIASIEYSRQTHVQWRDWLRVNQDDPAAKIAGDVANHDRFIAGYDNVLAVLRSSQPVQVEVNEAEYERDTAFAVVALADRLIPGIQYRSMEELAETENEWAARAKPSNLLAEHDAELLASRKIDLTDDMVERAAQAFGGLTATNWSGAEEWERDAVRDSIRRALSAALGGGDHAE